MIILEMVIPAAWFLWMGISAFVVGLILYVMPTMPLLIQVIIFGVLSVVSLLLYKRHQKENPTEKDDDTKGSKGQPL